MGKTSLAPIRLKNGHMIDSQIVQTFTPWCGICKDNVGFECPTEQEAMRLLHLHLEEHLHNAES